jgi:hypothetical protein
MKTKSVVSIGIGICCLLCSIYISYTIIQRGYKYYGVGHEYVEQGKCTVIESVLQHRQIDDATPREGPLATMRAYYNVDFLTKKNETISNVSAISRLDNAGWTGDVNSVSDDLAKYVPGKTVRCFKGTRTISFYAKDINSIEHLVVLGHDAKEVQRKFKVAFFSGISISLIGVLVLIFASIYAILHERTGNVEYTSLN